MRTLTTALALALAATVSAQNPNPLRVNQVGYAPEGSKTAAIEECAWAKSYTLSDEATGRRVWRGKALRTAESPWSGKKRAIIDFSSVTQPGTYVLRGGDYTQRVVIIGWLDALEKQ